MKNHKKILFIKFWLQYAMAVQKIEPVYSISEIKKIKQKRSFVGEQTLFNNKRNLLTDF